MLTIHAHGVFKKTAEILNKELLPKHKSPTDWYKVKVDLEELSNPQLDLVLRLIEQMKTANKVGPEKGQF
ncbi:hypothetical protein ACFLTP_03235 [Chloroflexota bacterium]